MNPRAILCSAALLLAAVGAGVGLAEGAATNTPVLPGTGTTITKCTTGLSLSGAKSPARLTCAPTGTTTTTTVPPTTTTTTTGGGTWACVTSSATGDCPFGADPQITGAGSGRDPYVDNNVWNPVAGWHQTLSANGPGDWQVAANMPASNTGVASFANTGIDPVSNAVDSYSQTTSSFAESMPHNAQTSGWAMYDLWYNNWAEEVMIQYDFSNNGDCTSVATAQFGGSNGVPLQTWHLCDFGSTLAWKLGAGEGAQKQSESSGAVDILAMSKWLETHGYLPAASTWTAISDGWEICSTGGASETFAVSGYSLTMVP